MFNAKLEMQKNEYANIETYKYKLEMYNKLMVQSL